MTQRVLTCKNEKEARNSLIFSILLTIPVVLLFLAIGALLFVYYLDSNIVQNFESNHVTIFMYYILNEMPEGLRGFVTVGAIAAALSSTNSVLGAMSSVAIQDLYKPYKKAKGVYSEEFFLQASRKAVLIFAFLLTLMAMLSYYFQHNSEIPLISFALGVMVFAYAGLLGVYASALFTNRGNEKTVLYALIAGFVSVLAMQSYVFGINIGFSYSLVIGSIVSFFVMSLGAKVE